MGRKVGEIPRDKIKKRCPQADQQGRTFYGTLTPIFRHLRKGGRVRSFFSRQMALRRAGSKGKGRQHQGKVYLDGLI